MSGERPDTEEALRRARRPGRGTWEGERRLGLFLALMGALGVAIASSLLWQLLR